MLCALFAATGLLAVGIKWLLVVALVLTVASASTLRFGRMPRA
jgi:hypothetical protein